MDSDDSFPFPLPVMYALHEAEYTFDLLWSMKRTWGPERSDGGTTRPQEDEERIITENLEAMSAPGQSGQTILMVPPLPEPSPAGTIRGKVGMKIKPGRYVGGELHKEGPIEFLLQPLGRFLEFSPLLRAPRSQPLDYEWVWQWFVQYAGEVAMKVNPLFCLAAGSHQCEVPELRDPRARVWPATYYGPAMVERIGYEKLCAAPARRVDDVASTGGVWVHVHENPLEKPDEAAEACRLVQEHLGVQELYPSDGSAPLK